MIRTLSEAFVQIQSSDTVFCGFIRIVQNLFVSKIVNSYPIVQQLSRL